MGIDGYATTEATWRHAERFASIQHTVIGGTGLHCSLAGFGSYRIADEVALHREALGQSLAGGINLIDTSANYADGASESLVGKVLTEACQSGMLRREEIIIVSKVGYLQGQNYDLSQSRKAQGNPFPELVPYAEGLEHCLHPVFIEDQLTRSLERLNLVAIDFYLLHNPEYYLGWASREGVDLQKARNEYDRRIAEAFRHLEGEVRQGRIRYYGISSNTFPVDDDRPDFTSLQRVLELAAEIDPRNHFALIQFPMNLIERGGVLFSNQRDGTSLLAAAREANLGILINRPLNALTEDGLLRLADVPSPPPQKPETITQTIQDLIISENALVEELLPRFGLTENLQSQIANQMRIGPALLKQHRDFPSYDYWEQIKSSHVRPRIDGALNFLEQQAPADALREWSLTYRRRLAGTLDAVTSIYAPSAVERAETIKRIVAKADPDWRGRGRLSQLAIRTLRTTRGVSSVLVGMRHPAYVDDVLEELCRPGVIKNRDAGWALIGEEMESVGFSDG